jgi:hypothetical protein
MIAVFLLPRHSKSKAVASHRTPKPSAAAIGAFVLFAGFLLSAAPAQQLAPPTQTAISPELGAAEVKRCEEKVATARRDILGRYDSALADLQATLQKGADLEGALAVRAERQRITQNGELAEPNFVAEPKALHALQVQYATRAQDLITQLVSESVPRLVELKKQLTVAGRLDEAVTVRSAIERLQNSFTAVIHPDPNLAVAVETLQRAYAADRARADATYKDQKVLVRGTVVGFRPDPNEKKQYLIYLAAANNATSWIECAFPIHDYTFREDKQFNVVSLLVASKDPDTAPQRLLRGTTLEVTGTCIGLDEVVKLQHCAFPR